MKEPIILYPKITSEDVWKNCQDGVEENGGISEDNPKFWLAASCADPGCCQCPSCHAWHWRYGMIHKCPTCQIVYPTDWHHMYADGANFKRRSISPFYMKELENNLLHPYFKYGYENQVDGKGELDFEAWNEGEKLDWKTLIGDCYFYKDMAGGVKNYQSEIENG